MTKESKPKWGSPEHKAQRLEKSTNVEEAGVFDVPLDEEPGFTTPFTIASEQAQDGSLEKGLLVEKTIDVPRHIPTDAQPAVIVADITQPAKAALDLGERQGENRRKPMMQTTAGRKILGVLAVATAAVTALTTLLPRGSKEEENGVVKRTVTISDAANAPVVSPIIPLVIGYDKDIAAAEKAGATIVQGVGETKYALNSSEITKFSVGRGQQSLSIDGYINEIKTFNSEHPEITKEMIEKPALAGQFTKEQIDTLKAYVAATLKPQAAQSR